MTQNLICPEFFNHELFDAKDKALAQANAALSDPSILMMEEANRVSYNAIYSCVLYCSVSYYHLISSFTLVSFTIVRISNFMFYLLSWRTEEQD